MTYAFLAWDAPDAPFVDSEELRDWQQWRCAMCNAFGELQCDHDHQTGVVRGYLCRSCNCCAENYLPWCTGTTPAGRYGLVELYRSSVTGLPVFKADTKSDVDALFTWDGVTFDGHPLEASDAERFRALGYVLAMVRRVHADRLARAVR